MSLPLSGVRVVEMGQLIAVPHAVKMLADMGAQVIRVESHARLEGYRASAFYDNDPGKAYWNRGANFYEQNRNKLGVTLDLSKPGALDTLRDLIAMSDVFIENFTPRVMRNFKLEHDDLRLLRPDIVFVSSTGYGFTGPWSAFGAIGPTTEAASGLCYSTGYEGGPPELAEMPYTDYTAAEHTVFAIVTALAHRARTGRGQFVDVSQAQAASATAAETLMDYTANGRVTRRIGNRHPYMAPHGLYPCQGVDAWIAIAVSQDAEWASLCGVLEADALSDDRRFEDADSRWRHRAALDEALSTLTRGWKHRELASRLQAAGVPAGAVLNNAELLFDPHLTSRGFYEVYEHHPDADMPPLPYSSRPWKFAGAPAGPRRVAPLLGEHNRHVLEDVLGMAGEDVRAMEANGAIGSEPTRPAPAPAVPVEEQVRLGRILAHDPHHKQRVRDHYGKQEHRRRTQP